MPNRMIKDSIHDSEKVNAMTDFQFRLWINLITYVDDYGRGDARPAIIKGNCFPLRERLTVKDIDAALTGLAGIGCIVLYEIDGRPYLCFPNWEKHQTIRNKRSKFPAPDVDLQAIENNCKQLNANVPVIQSNPIQIESESESEREVRAKTRFHAPTPDEVDAYCKEKGIRLDAQYFCDYYEARGWKIKGQPMKDWKAAVRTWAHRDGQSLQTKEKTDEHKDTERMERMIALLQSK